LWGPADCRNVKRRISTEPQFTDEAIDRPAVVDDAQPLARQDRCVAPAEEEEPAAAREIGRELLELDGVGHAPLRVEDEELHAGREHRRRRLGLPTMILAVVDELALLDTRVMNSGMLSQTCISPSVLGIQRQRSMLAISRCASEPASAGWPPPAAAA
jgi:hypothetical protein